MENKIVKHIEVNGVTYDVPTIEGFDLTKYGYSTNLSKSVNATLEEAFEYTNDKLNKNKNKNDWTSLFENDNKFVFVDTFENITILRNAFSKSSLRWVNSFDLSNVTDAYRAFYQIKLEKITTEVKLTKATDIVSIFRGVSFAKSHDIISINVGKRVDVGYNLKNDSYLFTDAINLVAKKISIIGDRITSFQACFNYCEGDVDIFECFESERVTSLNLFNTTTLLKNIKFGSLENCTIFISAFNNSQLKTCEFDRWKQGSISFSLSKSLSIESIKYDIFHAMNSADGATSRTLTLHATPLATWNNEVANTTPTAEDAELLGVEDWDRYKKEDGTLYTWGEITSLIKDITIA